MTPQLPLPIRDLETARHHIASFPCPEGFSAFAWKQLQHTATCAWHAHLSGSAFRGSLHFCRPEFYDMLRQPSGEPIVPEGLIRRYLAA